MASQFTMYTTSWCPFCVSLKNRLAGAGITWDEIDIDADPEAALVVMRANGGHRTVPTLVYPDGTVHTNPSADQVRGKVAALTPVA